MNTNKLIYWISTSLFSASMLYSSYLYFTAPELKGAFVGLGFTQDYFRIELGIAKILGALALILPMVPKGIKNFAYAGFTINLVSAIIAHMAMGYHSYGFIVFSVITLSLSYYSFLKLPLAKEPVLS